MKTRAEAMRTTRAPFGTATAKTSYFDQFSRPCEDEDPSLYADKLNLWARIQSRSRPDLTLELDRDHWSSKTVIIDEHMDRGLLPNGKSTRRASARSGVAPESAGQSLFSLSQDERRLLDAFRMPTESSVMRMSSVGSTSQGSLGRAGERPSSSFLASSRAQHAKSVWACRTGSSGLAPPQVSIGKGSMVVEKPSRPSAAFLATGKAHRVPNMR